MRFGCVRAVALLLAACSTQSALGFLIFPELGTAAINPSKHYRLLPQLRCSRSSAAYFRCCSVVDSKSQDSSVALFNSVVLVCTGDACEDVGARDLIKLARQRATQSIKCKSTGCLGMCGQGPAIAVQNSEGGVLEIYRDVDDKKLDSIFQELQT
jgi:(2Fe-2S) ferredoxin